MHNSRGSPCWHWIRFSLKTDRDRDHRLLWTEGPYSVKLHEALTLKKLWLATLFVPSCYLWLVAFLSSPWQLERGSVCSTWKKRSKKYHIYIFCQSPSSSSSLSSLSSSSLLMSSLSRCQDVSLHHSESLNFPFVVFCVLYRANAQEEIFRCLFWQWK